ncbi:hypothetical protein [uncultured Mucilaginibacter sp.]|uniref:hypothetical protein n=1 Tax=uncultured Mucilaginibacter sp. TaxID=797541 RepID=UPI00263895AD|nr:hypothetical protein [uncultured Mucilaginibacter sp.]
MRPGAWGGMPPGGDPKCLISLVLLYQDKRTDKKTYTSFIHLKLFYADAVTWFKKLWS